MSLVFLVFLWRHRKEAFYARHMGLKRRQKAQGKAIKGIRRLKRSLKSAHSEEKRRHYFSRAHRVMSEYLADKFNISAQGLTMTEITAQMEHFDIDPAVNQKIKDFYEITDRARFALSLVSADEAAMIISTLEETVKNLEKKIR
jgi:hypothetical protein